MEKSKLALVVLVALLGVGLVSYLLPQLIREPSEIPKTELEILHIVLDETEKEGVIIVFRNNNPRPDSYLPERLMIDIVGLNFYYPNGTYWGTADKEDDYFTFPTEALLPEEEGEIVITLGFITPEKDWKVQVQGRRVDTSEEILSQLYSLPEFPEWMYYTEELKMINIARETTNVTFRVINCGRKDVEIAYVLVNDEQLSSTSYHLTKNPIEVGDEAILAVYYNWISGEIYTIEIVTQRGNIFQYTIGL